MTDTPILLLFFNRPEQLSQVFNSIKEAKPKMLFLAQDGPREGCPEDFELINECRKIVENIDWDCKVYKNYSEVNMTCDHKEFSAISWCFNYVDRLLILEDDCVPVKTFYKFCDELLEKYKDDNRIHSISGFNRLGIYNLEENDYIFSNASCGWGWATWKRVWDIVVELSSFSFVEDKNFVNYKTKFYDKNNKLVFGDYILTGKKYKKLTKDKILSWEYLQGMPVLFENMMTITPKKNMIKYIGFCKNALHAPSDIFLATAKIKKMCMSNSYDIEFPIKHPNYIMRNTDFERKSYYAYRGNKYIAWMEVKIRKIIYSIFIKK